MNFRTSKVLDNDFVWNVKWHVLNDIIDEIEVVDTSGEHRLHIWPVWLGLVAWTGTLTWRGEQIKNILTPWNIKFDFYDNMLWGFFTAAGLCMMFLVINIGYTIVVMYAINHDATLREILIYNVLGGVVYIL